MNVMASNDTMVEHTVQALSIGPVIETLDMARKTAEIWAASYIFSNFAREFLIALCEKKKASGWTDEEFFIFSPCIDEIKDDIVKRESNEKWDSTGVGCYSDRIFIRCSTDISFDKDIIDTVKESVIESITKSIHKTLTTATTQFSSAPEFESVKLHLSNYIYVAHFCQKLSTEEFSIEALNKALDALELAQPFLMSAKDGEDDYLDRFLSRRTLIQSDLIRNEGYYIEPVDVDHHENLVTLPSLPYIAARSVLDEKTLMQLQIKAWKDQREKKTDEDILSDFVQKEFDKREQERINKIELESGKKEKALALPRYARYVALVQADGDGVGTTINNLKSAKDIEDLSRQLLTFSKLAAEKVKNYGALPVYFGGDDMLFFAPLISKCDKAGEHKDLFSLLLSLEELFNKTMNNPALSLSFSVIITYYKYPMNETRSKGWERLSEGAKAAKWSGDKEKRATCARLIRHSGQSSEFILPNEMINRDEIRYFLSPQAGQAAFMRSIHRKLISQSGIVFHLIELPSPERESRLKSWFANNFNEPVHEELAEQMHVDKVSCMLTDIYEIMQKPDSSADKEKKDEFFERYWQNIDAIFRYYEFLESRVEE